MCLSYITLMFHNQKKKYNMKFRGKGSRNFQMSFPSLPKTHGSIY